MVRITGLHVYPVKSLGGMSVSAWPIEARGPRGDRRWMLVDPEGRFVTQREIPLMCRIRACLDDDGLSLRTPEGDTLTLPPPDLKAGRIPVTIWRSDTFGLLVSEEADAWFSERLGQPLRLVYMPDDVIRETNPEFSQPGDHVGFADGYPITVISGASLRDLNSRLEESLPINRFRPNIVVEGCEAFAEDSWKSFEIGSIHFRLAKPSARCQMTATDQATGEVGKEPLRTLASFRRWDGKVWFASNFIPESTGVIRVGDEIRKTVAG